jgi:hypothetical protein
MRLMKFVMLTVLMWNFKTKGRGRDLRTEGRSLVHRLHSCRRWQAVCIAFSGQLQFGEDILFIVKRYDRKLPWFVRKWVRGRRWVNQQAISKHLTIPVVLNQHC